MGWCGKCTVRPSLFRWWWRWGKRWSWKHSLLWVDVETCDEPLVGSQMNQEKSMEKEVNGLKRVQLDLFVTTVNRELLLSYTWVLTSHNWQLTSVKLETENVTDTSRQWNFKLCKKPQNLRMASISSIACLAWKKEDVVIMTKSCFVCFFFKLPIPRQVLAHWDEWFLKSFYKMKTHFFFLGTNIEFKGFKQLSILVWMVDAVPSVPQG